MKYKFSKGHIPWNKGIKTGLVPKTAFKKGIHPKTQFKKGQVAWNKGIPNIYAMGEKSHLWKGGTTPISTKIRESLEYKLWRTAVFIRDNHTCRVCDKRGGMLQADHIKPFSLYPELRFAIDNGRTLCVECHKQTDTYGRRIFSYARRNEEK